jgi:hypothetical protein
LIAERLAELESLCRHSRQPRKATPPEGIQSLARQSLGKLWRAGVSRDDRAMLGRAADGLKLRRWEPRRIEYLAVKLSAREGIALVRRPQ